MNLYERGDILHTGTRILVVTEAITRTTATVVYYDYYGPRGFLGSSWMHVDGLARLTEMTLHKVGSDYEPT